MALKPFTPRPCQLPMIEHLMGNWRCALWAGMGTGKTLAGIAALNGLFMLGEESPALVLAPLRVARTTWPRAVRQWSTFRHLSIVPITGSEKERKLALKQDAPIFTCNYDNVPWLVDYLDGRWPFKTVIADESTRVKSFRLRQGGARAMALGRVAHKDIKRFWEFTGTPGPNGLADLWGQIWFLDAGVRLGRTYDSFKQRWFQANHDGYGITPLPTAADQIYDKLRDLCLTVEAKDWFDLKEPIMNTIHIELPSKARALYRDMEREMFMQIEHHEIEAFNAAARTQKLLQLCNGANYVGDPDAPGPRAWAEVHDQKLQALESVVEEAAGMPVMCGYEFKSDKARIMKAFPKAVDISTDDGFAVFMAGESPLGLAHPASMGHGIDGLQNVTNQLVLFGHNWNLEQYMQLIERIGPTRQMQAGLDRPVYVHHIVARDTVDEDVMLRRETKRTVQDLLLEAMKRRHK